MVDVRDKMMEDLFKQYQRELVDLANSDDGRKFLGIEKEIDLNERIVKLTPNSYHTKVSENECKAVFRCYPLFAKKLQGVVSKVEVTRSEEPYQGLERYEGLLHYCGLFRQPKVFPQIFLRTPGFYSGAGDGFTYKDVDGAWNQANWDTCHDAADGTAADNAGTYCYSEAWHKVDSPNFRITRSFYPVDTSSLPDACIITSATFRLRHSIQDNDDDDGNDYIVIVEGTQAATDAVGTADFDQVGSTAWTDTVDLGAGADNKTYTLNTTGIAAISKTGWTKLASREGHDMIDELIAETSSSSVLHTTSEYTGTAYDPYLVVIHNPRGRVSFI